MYDNYRIVLQRLSEEDGGGFVATVPSLPGCMSDGETVVEAMSNIQDAIQAWIETARELGRKIPSPDDVYRAEEDFSGKLLLRIPKSLHKKITERAEEENVSINQLIQSYISFGIGFDHGLKSILDNYIVTNTQSAYRSLNKQWKETPLKNSISLAALNLTSDRIRIK